MPKGNERTRIAKQTIPAQQTHSCSLLLSDAAGARAALFFLERAAGMREVSCVLPNRTPLMHGAVWRWNRAAGRSGTMPQPQSAGTGGPQLHVGGEISRGESAEENKLEKDAMLK